MKVLQVHNRYRNPGGEDTVLANEARLLGEHGHQVDLLEVRNDEQDPETLMQKLDLVRNMAWSTSGAEAMDLAIRKFQPDVVHVHNTFSKLSPRVLRIASARGVAVVQTMHNFRLFCANALLLREGRPCELCLDKGRSKAIQYRCYRGNRVASAAVTATGAVHLRLGTFRARGLRVIALTEFGRSIFLRGGIGKEVLRVKPNFVYPTEVVAPREKRIVFVGRLAAEKGVDLLLEAWKRVRPAGWALELVGDGDLRGGDYADQEGIRFLGWRSPDEVIRVVAGSRFLVMASRWYETFGMVLIEAFSAATPVIVPAHGAMAEIVDDGVTGFAFEAGSVDALARTLRKATEQAQDDWHRMSASALEAYWARYSPQSNHRQLMSIYQEALGEASA